MESYAIPPTVYRYRDPARFTSWLRIALWTDIAVSLVYLVVSIAGAFTKSLPPVAGPLLGIWFAVFLIAAALFLLWIYRTAANASAFGADITFDPSWAAGWLVIPVVNVWMAFVVIEEIWRASIDGPHWRSHFVSWAAIYWWSAWVVACIGATLLYLTGGGLVAKVIYFAGHIAYAFLLIPIVERIRDLQQTQSPRCVSA